MDKALEFFENRNARRRMAQQGTVYLVGAGPGDPELLTVRALRLLQAAEVLVYDNLVSPAVLDLANSAAEKIYAGKERGNHSLPQEQINQLLVEQARRGLVVVRLKGGDPYVFGRGGEEVETLAAAGVPFEVVPGVTAASGVAAYAGIPLTHRGYASACVLAAGYLKDGTIDLDWAGLARPRQTIVIYMGLHGLPVLAERLIAHGLPPDTPTAIVQQGTTPQQRVVTGTLATLPEIAVAARLKPPTLVVIGEVVRLRDKLAWFQPESAPVEVPPQ
jgi:uroporphyrin-III C-methyltransferase